MKNPINKPKRALIMPEAEWEKNKKWLLQFPGAFCNPVIERLEHYLFEMPTPSVPLKGEVETSPLIEKPEIK